LTFAAILFVSVVGVFNFQIISTHMVPHATDMGISPSAAAAALGLMGGFSIPGRMLSGLFSARFGWYRLLSFAYFGTGASMVYLWSLRDIWMLYLFAFFYGVFHGMRISATVGVLPEIFGMVSLGELIGIFSAVGTQISALAPYAAGALFDATGSYSIAFLLIVPDAFDLGSRNLPISWPHDRLHLVKYGKHNFQLLKEFRSLGDAHRQSLFGLAVSRLVEDVLADLDRPDIFVGPIWGYLPLVGIQCAAGSVR